jgi:hypothetical protein
MSKNFENFIKKFNFEPKLEKALLEGYGTLIEEVASVTSAMPDVAAGQFAPSIHKAAPWIQRETTKNFNQKKLMDIFKKNYTSKNHAFLEMLNLDLSAKRSLTEAFEVVVDNILNP